MENGINAVDKSAIINTIIYGYFSKLSDECLAQLIQSKDVYLVMIVVLFGFAIL